MELLQSKEFKASSAMFYKFETLNIWHILQILNVRPILDQHNKTVETEHIKDKQSLMYSVSTVLPETLINQGL